MNIAELPAKAICLLTLTHARNMAKRAAALANKLPRHCIINLQWQRHLMPVTDYKQPNRITHTHIDVWSDAILYTSVRLYYNNFEGCETFGIHFIECECKRDWEKDSHSVALFGREKAHKREQIKITWKMTFFFFLSLSLPLSFSLSVLWILADNRNLCRSGKGGYGEVGKMAKTESKCWMTMKNAKAS